MHYTTIGGTKFNIEDNKHMYFIYGKNGSGKTTLANTISLDNYEKIIFGSEFIRKNIYVSNEIEEKSTSTNSTNLTNFLLVDEETIKLQMKIESLQSTLKDVEKFEFSDKHQSVLKAKVDNKVITHFDKILSAKNHTILNSTYFDDEILDFEKECSIKNKEEFEEKLLIIKNDVIISTFIKELNNSGILNFISEIDVFNEKLERYNELIDELKKINSYTKENTTIEEWKIAGLSHHEGLSKCYFCNGDLMEDYKKMKDYYENKIFLALNKLRDDLKKIIEEINRITSNQLYKKKETGVKKEILILEKLNNDLSKIYTKTLHSEDIQKSELLDLVDISLSENDVIKLNSDLIEFMTIKQLRLYLDNKILRDNLDESIKFQKIKLEELYKSTIERDVQEINQSLQCLELDEEIVLNINNASGKKRIKLEIKNKKQIQDISEGEKHKLALAIFMTKLKKINLNEHIIVFDDPVITLDVQTYFRFREYIQQFINDRLSKTNAKLLILSHNIHYLYVQSSNLTANDEYLSFYKMNKDGEINQQSIDFIKMDDYSYFNYSISKVGTEQEFVLLFPMMKKMFRHSVDLISRMNGIPITFTEVEELLRKLKDLEVISSSEKQIVQKFSNNISSVKSKDTIQLNISVSDMFEYIRNFNQSMEIMKIPFKIELQIALTNGFDKTKVINLFEDLVDSDIVFDMLQNLSKMVLVTNSKSEANYLAHPNNQVTNSLVAFDF